jgi:hypothetical protein
MARLEGEVFLGTLAAKVRTMESAGPIEMRLGAGRRIAAMPVQFA